MEKKKNEASTNEAKVELAVFIGPGQRKLTAEGYKRRQASESSRARSQYKGKGKGE